MIIGRLVALGPILPVDMVALFAGVDDVAQARVNEPYRPQNWQRQEAFWTNAGDDRTRVFFAIRGATDPTIIGYVQITGIDPIHRSATISLRIGDASHRGQGKGSEALALAIDYCWRHLNLTRLGLHVFVDNARAIDLYRRLGFEREGTLRQAVFIEGAWVDVVMMALLHPARGMMVDAPRQVAA